MLADAHHAAAWQIARQDLTKTAARLNVAAYALGVIHAQDELDQGDLYDVRGQEFAAQYAYQSIRSLTTRGYEETQAVILNGIRQGLGTAEIARRLDEALGGLVPTVEVIARTEVLRASNWGRFSGWRKSGVVHSKEFIATLDERVDPEHLAAHGEVVPIDSVFTRGAASGYLMPPLRPNCRCTAAPVTSVTDPESIQEDVDAGEQQAEDLGLMRRDNPHLIDGVPTLEKYAEGAWVKSWSRGVARVVGLLEAPL